MKHLLLLLTRLYANQHIHLSETYNTDEVFNIEVEYHLRIDDLCSKKFNCFRHLEEYVYTLCGADKLITEKTDE